MDTECDYRDYWYSAELTDEYHSITYSPDDESEHFEVEAPLPSIPDGFAYKCDALKDFTVDGWQKSIGDIAFAGCSSLADFVILDSPEDIEVGISAFSDAGLKTLRQGRQLVYPDIEANSPFAGNATLESVWITDIPTSVGPYQFKDCPKLSKVNIGDRIEAIEHYAFSGCRAIESFAFGSAVKRIDEEAFSDCTGMRNLYAEPLVPPVCGSQALDDINRWECTLHVLPESEAEYAVAPQWKEFLFKDNLFGIGLNIATCELGIGETMRLEVVSNSAAGGITWMSTNESVVTVISTGEVMAVNPGLASVVAINSDGQMDNCAITVIDRTIVTDIVASEGAGLDNVFAEGLRMFVGESRVLDFTAVPSTTTSAITFMSADVAVADVNADGLLSALAEGECEVVIACGNISKSFTVTVEKREQSISWNQEFDKVQVGDVVELTATASSGLTVEYSVTSGSALIAGSALTAMEIGNVTVEATQSGNEEFKAAEPVAKTITVDALSGIGFALVEGSKVELIGNKLVISSGAYGLYDLQGRVIKTGNAPDSIILQANTSYILRLGDKIIKFVIR